MNILVAEDDDDIRAVFEMVLDDRYEIRCAGTAAPERVRCCEDVPKVLARP